MVKILKEDIEKDFDQFRDKILAILIFGSMVNEGGSIRSDIDICLVAPNYDSSKLFTEILRTRLTEKYDVKIFELLPLKLKGGVLENHIVLWSKDEKELSYYLHKWGRVWQDQKMELKKLGLRMFLKYA